MKLYPNKLSAHLSSALKPVYIITGDEPMQVNECLDAIRVKARKEGYLERTLYSVDIDSSYDDFLLETDNMSLFSDKKIIEIRMPKGKPGKEWAKALNNYLDRPSEDTLLLLSGAKLERGVSTSAWFKKADKIGVKIETWPLDPQKMMAWISAQMLKAKLRATHSAKTLIAQRVEGNLLAAEQEILKLSLLYPDIEIGDAEVISSVANSSRYSIFDLSAAALSGHSAKACKILQALRGEGVADVLVLWSLSQEARLLAQIAQAQLSGVSSDAAMKAARVQPKKIALIKTALHRHNERSCLSMLALTSRLDRLIKGRETGDAWAEMLELTMMLSGKKLALH
jgi:DNA polymerase-3 subunit delta